MPFVEPLSVPRACALLRGEVPLVLEGGTLDWIEDAASWHALGVAVVQVALERGGLSLQAWRALTATEWGGQQVVGRAMHAHPQTVEGRHGQDQFSARMCAWPDLIRNPWWIGGFAAQLASRLTMPDALTLSWDTLAPILDAIEHYQEGSVESYLRRREPGPEALLVLLQRPWTRNDAWQSLATRCAALGWPSALSDRFIASFLEATTIDGPVFWLADLCLVSGAVRVAPALWRGLEDPNKAGGSLGRLLTTLPSAWWAQLPAPFWASALSHPATVLRMAALTHLSQSPAWPEIPLPTPVTTGSVAHSLAR